MTAPTSEPTADPRLDGPPPAGQDRSIEAPDDQARDGATDAHPDTPDAANGAVGGTDGVTKNQDDTAQ